MLSHEIDRLIRLADIRLETGAVIDFAKLGELAADLVILDPTGLPEDFRSPAGAVACDPFAAGTVAGSVVTVELPKNLAPFKAPMIAHYIAAGRLLARKVSDGLHQGGGEGLSADLSALAVDSENIKIERFQAGGPSTETETRQDEKQDREWAIQEADRCLSCGTCNLCLQCVSFCPDASIRPDGEEDRCSRPGPLQGVRHLCL